MLGTRFGRLVVVAPAEPKIRANGKSRRRWKCRCDCGNETVVTQSDLKTGNTRSCGCLNREVLVSSHLKHGQSKTPTYRVWSIMRERCFNPNNDKYPDYGGRGITVCDAWRTSYEAFVRDMGLKPPGLSIDRIDNEGDYEPGNCRWATLREQGANKRNNIIVEWQGETMILGEAIRRAGLPRKAVEHRLRRGWPVAEALSTPLRLR